MRIILTALLLIFITTARSQVFQQKEPLAHTFSIVARDPVTGEFAVAVQSHWFSVGNLVSWGEAGVGVVATQSFVNPAYGPRGLQLLKEGKSAQEALDILIAADSGRDVRQVAIVDARGRSANYTGSKCIDHHCGFKGPGFSVQANMMLNETVCSSMEKAWNANTGLSLPERMVAVLKAAQNAGGDIRGKQSAVLLVYAGTSTGMPWADKKIDLRVDDHPQPIQELDRLLRVFRAYEHMNNGDLAVEKGDMKTALQEYGAAEKMFPGNLEMQYWHAIALANQNNIGGAAAILKKIFAADKNWKELTRRLPKVGLLNISEASLKRLLSL